MNSNTKKYYNLGLELFGPLIYEFCNFIKSNNHKSQLLFVSREGSFFKQCYNLMYPQDKTKMIYLSRTSLITGVASEFLKQYSLNDLINIMSFKQNETISELFTRIGLNANKYKKKLLKFEIDLNSLANKKDLNDFFYENKHEIINDLKKYNEYFDKYLDQVLSKNNTIVDIGWKGSMQNILTKYLEIKKSCKSINGIYLGVMDNINKLGYLFNSNNNICQNVLNYSGLLELIMMPTYGSVIGYKEINNEILPIFAESEFSNKSLKIIKSVQNGIIDFIKNNFVKKIEYDKNQIIKNLNNFGSKPKLKNIKLFKNLEFYDNGKVYHLIEPIKLKNIKDSFINSKWKTAYLKNLLKITLPYNKIVIWLRNYKHYN